METEASASAGPAGAPTSVSVPRPADVVAPVGPENPMQGDLSRFLQTVLYLTLLLVFRVRETLRRIANLCWPRTDAKAGAPAHVALAGAVDSNADAVARLALAAQRAGAARFSVCARSAVAIEKACARIGVRIAVRVLPPAPRTTIVRAARAIAALPPAARGCDVADVPSVVRRLDEFHWANALDTEPDVLVLVPSGDPGAQAVCFASFSVWQLRLTQFRFAECPLSQLDDHTFLEMVCSATNVAKRFGR